MKTQGYFSKTMLGFGFFFLYVPILSMIFYSFNNSRLVTVWDAANSPTLKWYGRLFQDNQVLSAAWLSIQVAAMTATGRVSVWVCAQKPTMRGNDPQASPNPRSVWRIGHSRA